MKLDSISENRIAISHIFYGYMLLVFLVEGYMYRLVHDLAGPILINPGSDNFYWLFHLLCVPQFIAGSVVSALAFEIMLLLITMLCIIFPCNNYCSIFFTLFFAVYIVTKNSFVAHHEHGLNGPLIMSLLFWVKNNVRFLLLFKAFRYYVIFMFVSAAAWKITRGSVFLPGQLSEILKTQHLQQLVFYSKSMYSEIISWLIEYPAVSNLFLISGTLLQFSFIIGFFTYRLDRLLLILFFLFFLCDYFLMGLSFYQWYVMAIVFLPTYSLRKEFVANLMANLLQKLKRFKVSEYS